ncbi:T9SS type A sorting domain-containing protein [Cytophaga aurantiaca]|uniref:T9SS type A sorting domain-containing protein n=1 Tax=Cytophaga aurantiaca TaxID=29530 RepID=UPI00036A0ED5|nr:T9SS type A sorting domain-containing protein [Cytophaga aurantiaca]
MKKVLLSLSMLAAVMVANAQNQVVLWNSANGATQITGVPFNFGVPDSNPNNPNVANPPAIDGGLFVDTVTVSGVQTITATGSRSAASGGYYVGGMGNGSFQTANVGKPWGTNVTGTPGSSMATYYFNFKIKSASPGPKIKVQLESKDSTNVQGYIVDLSAGTTGGNYQTVSIALGSFSNTIGQYGDPIGTTGNFMTKAFADSLFKVGFSVNNAGLNGGEGAVSFTITDIWISTSKAGIVASTSAAAANIASSVVYPNPTSGDVKVNITLQNPASVTMIVTDMVGKQIATKNFGTVSSLSDASVFDAAGLAKGMYTVTYVLDGTPAKTELVVVK